MAATAQALAAHTEKRAPDFAAAAVVPEAPPTASLRARHAAVSKALDDMAKVLDDLLAALPRCRQCTSPATGRYDTDDRYCDAHRIEGNDLWCAYDWAPELRRALAERGRA